MPKGGEDGKSSKKEFTILHHPTLPQKSNHKCVYYESFQKKKEKYKTPNSSFS